MDKPAGTSKRTQSETELWHDHFVDSGDGSASHSFSPDSVLTGGAVVVAHRLNVRRRCKMYA